MRVARYSALVSLVVAGVVAAPRASADSWLTPRHDAGRTGASSGAVPLTSGTVKWRAYTGGRPTSATVKFGLGAASELVSTAGGRFVAKSAITQAPLWTSELLGAGSVVDIADLDGDGAREVIVQTASSAHVLNGSTGALAWSSPETIEIMGAVRVRDLDGDGLPDIYLDNGIGAKPGSELVAAYSFASGAATKLWSLPTNMVPQAVNSGTDSVLDVDGDGVAEVVLSSWTTATVVRGSDGTTLTTLAPPSPVGNAYVNASAIAVELDGLPGLEVLMVQPHASAASDVTPGLSAFTLDPATGQSTFLWAIDTGDVDSEFAASADVASDLDGDGTAEIIFSYRSAQTGDGWVTEVRSGASGALLETLADARFEGAAELDDGPGAELVVAQSNGLSVFSLSSGSMVQVGATVPGLRALGLTDDALARSGPTSRRLAVAPGVSGTPVLYLGKPTSGAEPQAAVGSFDEVRGAQVSNGAIVEVGNFSPLVGTVTGAIRADFATRPYEQIALGTSEGLVAVLNRELEATNGFVWVNGEPLGTFVGGGQAAPVLASADQNGPFIVLPSTGLGTIVADARFASWIIPPIPRWWNEKLSSPSLIELLGETRVVGFENHALTSRSTANGSLDGSVSLPGLIWGSPVPLHTDAGTLVGVDVFVDGQQIQQTAIDLSNSSTAWTAPPIAMGGYFGSSVGDVDGDGVDEWYSLVGALIGRSAVNGTSSNHGDFPGLGYSLPMVTTFNGTSPELLLQAGGKGATLLANDFTTSWDSNAPEAVNTMNGTRTACGASTRFVTPSVQSPYLRSYDGATGQLVAERAYAGGQAYASAQAALADGAKPGFLSHANSVADLAGNGAAVLAGSSDGHLYVVDACTLDVLWAADIGRSLGEPVIADVDDDGEDEVVVAGADGFVYGLDTACFEAPVVICGDDDEPTISAYAGESVPVSWAAIEGAESYEIALISPDEQAMWSPAYRSVEGTSTDIELDGALPGRPYRLAVRAVGVEGAGLEGFSKPLVLQDQSAPGLEVGSEGGMSATISFTATDDIALDHFLLKLSVDGQSEVVVADATLTGTKDDGVAGWQPPESVWGKDILLSLAVVDMAGLHSTEKIPAHVTEDGMVVLGADSTPSAIGEPDVDGWRESTAESAGCSAASSNAPTTVGAMLAAAFALAASRRRKLR